jgi:hypothetical protein
MRNRRHVAQRGPRGIAPAGRHRRSSPHARLSSGRARRSLGRLVVTPTFAAGACILFAAVLAYGTTQTHLAFRGLGPVCAQASCSAGGQQRPHAGAPGRTYANDYSRTHAATVPDGCFSDTTRCGFHPTWRVKPWPARAQRPPQPARNDRGHGASRHGHGGDRHGHGGDRHGHGGDRHGHGGDRHGHGASRHGHGASRHGRGGDHHGHGAGRPGRSGDHHGRGGNRHGRGGDHHGRGASRHGHRPAAARN